MKILSAALLSAVLLLSSTGLRAAEDPNPVETKLREALRNTMLQLRDSQGQVATLQGTAIQNEAKIKDLESQVDKLTKQSAADQESSRTQITALEGKVTERDTAIGEFKAALEKWKVAHDKAAALARSTESKRATLAAQATRLQRIVDDQQTKNRQMYELGTEILQRYEKFGLGDALTAREPFVGITRVKFENLIQDYSDQLTDTRITP